MLQRAHIRRNDLTGPKGTASLRPGGAPGSRSAHRRDSVGAHSRPVVWARDTSDGALVARCLAGDDAAWHALIGRYARLVEAVIRRYHLSPDEQADVFQDVWVALWRDLAAVRSHDRLGPWLVTAAGQMAWDARKRLARAGNDGSLDLFIETLVDEAADPERQVVRSERTERVRAALLRVSPRSRRCSRPFFREALSYAEIADELGCSPNSIGPIRARCFKEPRDALGDA